MIKRLPSSIFYRLRISPAFLMVVFLGFISTPFWAGSGPNWSGEALGAPLARDPVFVYNDWSAGHKHSDNIPLTEAPVMKEPDEMLPLRRFDVRFDCYMTNAFWFDPDRGSRIWCKPNWPHGSDAWI